MFLGLNSGMCDSWPGDYLCPRQLQHDLAQVKSAQTGVVVAVVVAPAPAAVASNKESV